MADVQEILAELVAIDTTNPPGCNYAEIADTISSYLVDTCDSVDIVGKDSDKPNVVARLQKGKGPSVAFNGHVDVVPAHSEDWEYPPFELTTNGNYCYGRGAVDMKGGLAAQIKAMELLAAESFQGEVIFTATINEETGGEHGLEWLIENQVVDADYWIITEPSNNDIYRCEKGAFWHRVHIQGEAAHGSRPHLGTNAIEVAVEAINQIMPMQFDDIEDHDILGKPTVNIGRINGGEKINIVPGRCSFEVDRRIIPDENLGDVVRETETVLRKLEETYDFTYDIEEIILAMPFETNAEADIVQAASTAIERMTGHIPDVSGTSGYTDARIPAVVSGKPTIIVGPGDHSASHIANEYIDLRQLERSPTVFREMATEILTQ
jgi:succinyl-diaminopimelate desuccinylase